MTNEIIHLVLGDVAAGVLGEAMANGAPAPGEILRFRDIYCLGPLDALGSPAGPASRAAYWCRMIPPESSPSPPTVADFEEEEARYARAREAAVTRPLLAWVGAHSSSQLWLQRLCAELPLAAPLNLVEAGAGPSRRTLSQFEPSQVGVLLARARPLAEAERIRLAQAWWTNAAIPSGVRHWGEGRISHHPDDHYDPLLLAHCDSDWQSADRVVGAALWDCDEFLGDLFFAWRLRCLAQAGRVLWRGPTERLGEALVRLPDAGDSATRH